MLIGRPIGPGHPAYLIAEIGINHNGSVDTALELVEAAAEAGADAVKFQVGAPRKYVNKGEWDRPRDTPWGVMPYIEYRQRMELSDEELAETKRLAESLGLDWFASPLDVDAVDRLEALGVPAYKVASPKLTDSALLDAVGATGQPVILSSGMSTLGQVEDAYGAVSGDVAILHCTSAYPCPPELVNLGTIRALQAWLPGVPIGFSDHTVGIPCSVAAVAMGASIIERHLTLSRAMWGSDHAASLEPGGFQKMAEYIRTIEAASRGVKRVHEAERANMDKFRLVA